MSNTETYLIGIVGAFLVMIPIAIQVYVIRKRKIIEEERTKKFFASLSSAISKNNASDLKDVLDIHESIFEDFLTGLSALERIRLQLLKLKTKLSTELVGRLQISDNEKALDKVNELLEKCQLEIGEMLKKKPFQGVSEPERHHLEVIYDLAESNAKELIHKSLLELSSAIKLRDEESKKYIDEQKESLSLAKKGLFATVGFSVISIALAIYFYVSAP
ncbi:hypothetical protein [Amphritea japonica]|uniref:Uncharacterized protein n=1 Tax=Amphritea japonica ATCC BAA-1530 TaxID=1278309 RepID=A0A7R6PN42_9GAMM|nr:hypothetical protein [Amphritea japonica]BBB27350.1 hypothetical protein AMJAP_2764 [Amphritea japonica ATCC BAA-1530]